MSATGGPAESLWPSAEVLRDAALLLVGLVLVALLADDELVLYLSAGLVLAWAFLSGRGHHSDPDASIWPVVLSVFVASFFARLAAPNEWFVVALIAISTPLVVLTRAALILRARRSA